MPAQAVPRVRVRGCGCGLRPVVAAARLAAPAGVTIVGAVWRHLRRGFCGSIHVGAITRVLRPNVAKQ